MTVKELKQDYFSFKGRLNRKPFLMRLMMLGVISIFFVLIVINAEPHLKEDPAHFGQNVRQSLVFWVYYIPLIISSISLGVRRLHDLNLSGWWMLLGAGAMLGSTDFGNSQINLAAAILFYVSQLFNVFLIFFRGTKGANRYGEDLIAAPAKEKKSKKDQRAEAKARKEAAEAKKRAEEELERQIAEAHPDWDEYDRYDALQEAKAKKAAEEAAAKAQTEANAAVQAPDMQPDTKKEENK